MGERLRDGSFALRLPLAARRPDRFVSHAYIVPYATDKTRRLLAASHVRAMRTSSAAAVTSGSIQRSHGCAMSPGLSWQP
jgi:hypothetical protein